MKPEACSTIRPLLLDALEGELDPVRARRVSTHLVACPACRAELVAERSLTSLLLPAPRRRSGARRLARGGLAAVCAGALLALPFLAGGPRAYGSVSSSRLALPALAWQEGAERPLAALNHIELSARDRVSFRIDAVGSLSAVGPAAFELDGSPEGWKLVLLRGEVAVEIEPGGKLLAVTPHGARELGAGRHVVELAPVRSQSASLESPGELVAAGLAAFFQAEDMLAAERAFRSAAEHASCTEDQRNQALFYLGAALSRLERYEEALAVSAGWQELFPADENLDYVRFFDGVHLSRLGRDEEARAVWERILSAAPESSLAETVRGHLDALSAPRRAAAASQTAKEQIGGVAPELRADGGYVVVPVALDPGRERDAAFLSVARAAAVFHEARVLPFDGADFEGLTAALAAAGPTEVLFVLAPERLDIDLHRRLLLASTRLDADPFADFAFGYFTARSAEALRALWTRTEERHAHGLASKRWDSCFVLAEDASRVYADYLPETAQAAGFRGRGLGFGTVEHDPQVLGFVERELPGLAGAGVIDLTGNGDPQGVWLFDDHRNLDAARHWDFAPERVGADPAGEMPRITAATWRALELAGPIVWSGTCHSAATHRVYVEGDIVSTFGRAEPGDVYELAPEESLCLALLDAGAVALLAPIAANHGYAVLLENDFALVNGAALGETIKSTWDDVCLQAGGELALDLHREQRAGERVMQGGGANRLLIGDPALDLFEPTPHPLEHTELVPGPGGAFEMRVSWLPGFHSAAWDLYGTDHAADGRVRARVDVTDLVEPGERVVATVLVTDDEGRELPYRMHRAELEAFGGRLYLHLQANAPRRAHAAPAGLRATFRVESRDEGTRSEARPR